MRLNYKPLGKYIQPVVGRNNDLGDLPLVGLSIQKKFIPSIANTIGTDMSTYRIIERNQFAYGPVTSRNGDKITIALFNDFDKALISQAYVPFEVKDCNELDPEYLMMWFRRPEFDRYARFKSHGSAREIFDWEEMCNTLLPIPHIDKQRAIVKEYNTIQNRIALNQQLIQKLEETAQAIYREWFVVNVDANWIKIEIKDFGNVVTGKTPSSESPEDFGNEMPFVTPGDFKNYNKFALGAERNLSESGYSKLKNKILPSGAVIVTCIGSDMGKISIAIADCITNQQMNSIVVKETFYTDFLYYYLQSISDEIKGIAMGGSTMPMLSKTDFEKIEVLKPDDNILLKFESMMKPINELSINYSKENQKLTELKELLLSKLATVE
ncbi:MAG: restriction endonuclease subunit S [Sediminibacterium sp.]|nr:restriction endonuclease subunit S [Sediminibacterium sp.]